MQFFIVLLRLLLDRLTSHREDRAAIAARADGRLEQVPTRWAQWVEQCYRWMSVSPGSHGSAKVARSRGDTARRLKSQSSS